MICRLKDQKAYATISILLFFPVFLIIVFGFGFISYFIQVKTQVRSLCLKSSIQIQKNLIAAEKNLFALNPASTSLRLQLVKAYADLAKGISTYNPLLVIEASLRITNIENQKRQLDLIQKSIINFAEIQSNLASKKLLFDLNQIFYRSQSIWSYYLKTFTVVELISNPEFAVKHDFSDDAPNYELQSDYKLRQRLTYYLQHKFSTKEISQKIISSENQFQLTCGTEPAREGNQWTVKIIVGKF